MKIKMFLSCTNIINLLKSEYDKLVNFATTITQMLTAGLLDLKHLSQK